MSGNIEFKLMPSNKLSAPLKLKKPVRSRSLRAELYNLEALTFMLYSSRVILVVGTRDPF